MHSEFPVHAVLDLNLAEVPTELDLSDLTDPDAAGWLALLCTVPWTLTCGICRDHIVRGDRAYFEDAGTPPAHVGCWMLTLPSRPVRVDAVRYH